MRCDPDPICRLRPSSSSISAAAMRRNWTLENNFSPPECPPMGGKLPLRLGAGRALRRKILRPLLLELTAYLQTDLTRQANARIGESDLLKQRPTAGSAVALVGKVGAEQSERPAIILRPESYPRAKQAISLLI